MQYVECRSGTDGSDCIYAVGGVGGTVEEQRAALLQLCHSEWKQVQNQQVFKTKMSHKFFLVCYYVNLIKKCAQKKTLI